MRQGPKIGPALELLAEIGMSISPEQVTALRHDPTFLEFQQLLHAWKPDVDKHTALERVERICDFAITAGSVADDTRRPGAD